MLLEAFKYLTTPCAPHFRSMGYLHELIATEARYHRCRMAWQPHLEQTKSVIKDAINQATGNSKAIVLGAGILSDIPIHTLSTHFKTVELIDVCFLNSTKKKVHQYGNIKLRTVDVTGLARGLHENSELPTPVVPDDLELLDADLVISANILSQLPFIPITYLQNKMPDIDEVTQTAFERSIIESHLGLLNRCPGMTCLITEVERTFLDGDHVLETEDLLSGVKLGGEGQTWFWDIAPKGEASPDYAIRNRVMGMYS